MVACGTAAVSTLNAAEPNELDRRRRELREARERRAAEAQAFEDAHIRMDTERDEHDPERSVREIEARIERLWDEINNLRLKQVDLSAESAKLELEGRGDELRELQRRLVDVEHELQRHELELDRSNQMLARESERLELVRMTDRLEYVSNWRDVAFDAPRAVMMATQALVEMFVDVDQPDRAVETLGGLLENVDEPGSRTAIRFALKDIYMLMNDTDRAAEQMKAVVVENARTLRDE